MEQNKFYVRYRKTEDNEYNYLNASNIEMNILGNFLIYDGRYGVSEFKEWALDDRYTSSGGNITLLEKENDFIIINDEFRERQGEALGFKIPKQAFINLLDEWDKVFNQKPLEILITYDGQKFTIETRK